MKTINEARTNEVLLLPAALTAIMLDKVVPFNIQPIFLPFSCKKLVAWLSSVTSLNDMP